MLSALVCKAEVEVMLLRRGKDGAGRCERSKHGSPLEVEVADEGEASSSSSNPSGGELTIERGGKRQPEVSTLAKARKHVLHRGSSFLAYVVDSRAETKKKMVADVSVVNEYRDVFSNDLPGILPEKQVECRIERVPGTAPIAKARTGSHVVLEDRSSLRVPPVEVREEDALETALRARYGHAKSIAMPFGLTNAPVAFYGRLGL
ncbi:hypothetical protein OSB04_un000711 [Centaurea solstitialis]|uniref:Uncharacterized protein n=1 Tax=Centaurea solstitialis TaxID=347529 RepID=A0AA38VV93_9ASTR|nr:hypothetical protein OSB04_un000711 [Centaurea solstitialis]